MAHSVTLPSTHHENASSAELIGLRIKAQQEMKEDFQGLLTSGINADVVLLGGTVTECWHGTCLGKSCTQHGDRCAGGPGTWRNYFSRYRTANLALEGDSFQDTVHKIEEFKLYETILPRVLVLFLEDSMVDAWNANGQDIDLKEENRHDSFVRGVATSLVEGLHKVDRTLDSNLEGNSRLFKIIVMPGSFKLLQSVSAPFCSC